MNPKEMVRDGYNRISYEYRDANGRGPTTDESGQPAGRPDYEEWVADLTPLVHDGDPVLDLGCGCGVPATAILAERYTVIGVDLSPVQVSRARQLVPRAQFECADMASIDFPPRSFAAVVSFYAIIHVPFEEQPAIFQNIHRWLLPGGYLLATLGSGAWTGIEADWLGAPMYWSHADRATYVAWLKQMGFEILWTRFIPEGSGGHTLLLAQRLSA